MQSSRSLALVGSMVRRLLDRFKQSVLSVQEYVLLSARGLAASFTAPRYPREIVAQMDSLGVGSLSIVVLTGMFTGMVMTLQSAASLDAFGARPYVGRLVCVSMVRELGPVLTALMVTGRVGSGMAAELGSMVVTQQIDALRVLGSDPIRKLVAPRLLAGIVMVPILTIISMTGLDEQKYANPLKVNFDRNTGLQVNFGAGVHRCIGMHLARLALRLASVSASDSAWAEAEVTGI